MVTCSARYESRNAMPKNSTTMPMRAIVLPLVNQDHSDGAVDAVVAAGRLSAEAAPRLGAGTVMEPGSPGPPLRTAACGAGIRTGGVSPAGDGAGGGPP